MKKNAFTLPEVLITLAVIGVVAAMSIPTLINKAKARRLHSQYMKAYSTLQQAMLRIDEDGNSAEPSLYYSNTGSYKDVFLKYLNGGTDCGARSGAFQSAANPPCYNAGRWNDYTNRPRYKNLTNDKPAEGSLFESGQIAMLDGSLWMFYIQNQWHPTTITIDINGYKTPPDRLGYDLFTFEYINGYYVPEGADKTSYTAEKYCSLKSSDTMNGVGCSVRAKNETDYFDWAIANLK